MTKPIPLSPKEWEARKSLLSKIPPMPEGKYSLLYPDNPWTYRDKANSGERGAGHKYATLSLLELKMMRPEIDRVAAENCALATWATAPMLGEAREVMDAWGFKYSTVLMVWIKSVKVMERLQIVAKNLGVPVEALCAALADQGLTVLRPKKGMGNWTRGNAEFLLLGTRGRVARVSKGVGSVVVSEPREHSRKPDEVRDRLVELFGDVPRLEMFGRASAPGWASWGLEVGIFDEAEEDGE